MHSVEEKEWLGPFGSCDVEGQGDRVVNWSSRLLLTVVHCNENVLRAHKPSAAGIQGPPRAFFSGVRAWLIAKPTQTTARVLRRAACV